MKAILERCRSAAEKGLTICMLSGMLAGWWGVLYPQLVLTQDAYRIVSEDGTVYDAESGIEYKSGREVYDELLNAERGKVRFRSRLLELVMQLYGSLCEE